MSSAKRLLDPELIPYTLWERSSASLVLAPPLSCAYNSLIDRGGLRELADSRDPDNPPVGGLDQRRTDQHFAQAFDGSVARAQLAVIDPKCDVSRISNAFIQSLSGNRVSITDAPCGAGAAAFAFLTTIAELRAQNILPREPLDVVLIGAEISKPAMKYATEMLEELRPFLAQQAVFVQDEFIYWNVLDRLANTDLITRMARTVSPPAKKLLVVANFNGFLEQEKRRPEAEPQLEELFRHASGDGAVVVWIEPRMNEATGGLFPGIMKWVKEKWSRFARVNTEGENAAPFLTSECKFQSPLTPLQFHNVRLSVLRVDLGRYK